MFSFLPTIDALLGVFSDDPAARVFQLSVLSLGIGSVYLLFYTTRDVLVRSSSILFQLFSIFLVALLPVAGFFLYLLFRPSRTIAEREMMRSLRILVAARGMTKAARAADIRRGPASSNGRSVAKEASISARS
ncbi:hypothetical protein HY464_01725 [Candidatus Peregrinibacteria bacterium]|nr:hypothetical protein [Candidatus Peregrinibacteria bacterium]MBI4129391.1 hypothetical protein [Candidatus Peregrinibacteria bacterium]